MKFYDVLYNFGGDASSGVVVKKILGILSFSLLGHTRPYARAYAAIRYRKSDDLFFGHNAFFEVPLCPASGF